jgi:hypothetical protein
VHRLRRNCEFFPIGPNCILGLGVQAHARSGRGGGKRIRGEVEEEMKRRLVRGGRRTA